MNEKQFTYLLGAGASARSLPVVDGITARVMSLVSNLSSNETKSLLTSSEQATLDEIIQELICLANDANEYYTIDTYAKSLYLKNDRTKLKKLKIAMSIYFTFEQGLNKVDRRYDSFFASLLSIDPKTKDLNQMPSNIKMLSWNYDYQVELSFSKFKSDPYLAQIEKFLNIVPNESDSMSKGFSLCKLNGTACSFQNGPKFERDLLFTNHDSKTDFITPESFIKLTRDIIEHYKIYKGRSTASIHFAWEDEPISVKTRGFALEATEATNILVVIGYSFPVFNREIDREIIKNMKNLEKIYIQIPKKDVDGVIQRFRAVHDFTSKNEKEIIIEPIVNTEEFFIPYEFGIPLESPRVGIDVW